MATYDVPVRFYSGVAPRYRRVRPSYPADLFRDLADLAPGRALAWDVGTGSNAAGARGLAGHFDRVVATDVCPRQVAEAGSIPKVEFHATPAHSAPLGAGTVDLVAAFHSMHFYADEGFFGEVRRVLRPRGLVAAIGYRLPVVDDGPIDAEVGALFWATVLSEYWHPSRRYVETAYADLPFPFPEVVPPRRYTIREPYTMARFIGYLLTWQGVRDGRKAGDEAARELVDRSLRTIIAAWGKGPPRLVRWPFHLRLGRRGEG